MEHNEKQLIDGLFSRLQQAESQSGPRDREAEARIREALQQQPAAPYYMAQAILVQEHALEQLNQRVQQLEQELSQRPAGGGGFLGGLFGAGNQAGTAANPPQRPGPAAGMTPPPGAGRGGFMGSAMQTAAAVAGGVLVGNMLASMFTGGGSAEAADQPPTDAGFDDAGGYGQDDFGSGSDSDLGGFDDFGDF